MCIVGVLGEVKINGERETAFPSVVEAYQKSQVLLKPLPTVTSAMSLLMHKQFWNELFI